MAQSNNKRTGSQLVGHRDLAARLRAEFPHHCIKVSRVSQGSIGECALTVKGANVRTVYERARVLACIAVLFNVAAFYNRQINKSRWTRYAALCGQSRGNSLQFRCGSETIEFRLAPVEATTAAGDFTLHLRAP